MDQVWTYIISPIAGAIAGGIMTLIFTHSLERIRIWRTKKKKLTMKLILLKSG